MSLVQTRSRLLWLCSAYGLAPCAVEECTIIVCSAINAIQEDGVEGAEVVIGKLRQMGGWPSLAVQEELANQVLLYWSKYERNRDLLDDCITELVVENNLFVDATPATLIIAGVLWGLEDLSSLPSPKAGREKLEEWARKEMVWFRPMEERSSKLNKKLHCPGSVSAWLKAFPGSPEMLSLLH